MALIINDLHTFQFERSIDWRVRIPNLVFLEPKLKLINPSGYFFCKSVTFPTSDIEVVDDPKLGIPGSYNSKKVVPTVTLSIYSDNEHLIEKALVKWNTLSFDEEFGSMPLSSSIIDPLSQSPVMRILIDRINPVDIKSVAANLVTPLNIDFPLIVIDTYQFDGYLSKAPSYEGVETASIRTLGLSIKVIRSKQLVVGV